MTPDEGIPTTGPGDGEGDGSSPRLFDLTPIPLWLFDLEELRFRAVNAAAVHTYGWTREEFLGMNIADIRDPADMPLLRSHIAAVGSESFRAGVWKHRAKDGRPILADITAHRMAFDGRPCIFVAALDVTGVHRARKELLDGEERLRGITSAASDAIVLLDAGNLVVFWNEAAERTFGWTSAEALGRDLRTLIVPERHASRHRAGFGRSASGDPEAGPVPSADMTARRRDGSEVAVELSLSAVEIGGRRHTVSILRDVTERRKAQERILVLSRAVEQSPASIVITDTAGTIQFVNPQFSRATGYSREEALGRNPRILKSGNHPPEFYAGIWKSISAGHEWRGEIQNRRKDGTLYWESATISPVTDAEGRVTHFVAVKEDISGTKVLEEQLRQAQKMEAVGRLAGGVAHDFNNLLTVIGGFSELAMNRMDAEDPRRPLLAEVRKAADRAAGLTRQLLAFSRRQILQPVILDLNAAVRGMESMLRRLVEEDVDIDIRLDPGLLPVRVDPGQVEQAIMNLCVNARDAMPMGGRIRISTRNLDVGSGTPAATAGANPGSHACIEVEDSGTGMTPDVVAHIFEPFFTTKPQGKGTGLGLPMVYGFVRQSGGAIEVDSVPGRGSVFRILLPAAGPAGDAAGAVGATGCDAVPESLRGTETILVVEDEAAVASIAARSLGDAGYTVLVAGGPEEAMRFGADHGGNIDLLLTDVVMPGIDGKEVAALVKGLRPGIRVLYMSGYTDDIIGDHGILGAGIAFLSKPFHPAGLCAKVREVLDAERPPVAC